MSTHGVYALLSALRAGFHRAITPPRVIGDYQPDIELLWLNEGTLLGISLPPPGRNR